MKHRIAIAIAAAGIVSILGVATAVLADGTNSNTNSGGGTVTWGYVKCLYANKCTAKPVPQQMPEENNKNAE